MNMKVLLALVFVAFLAGANSLDFALRYRGSSPDGRVFTIKGGSQRISTTITPAGTNFNDWYDN